MRSVRHVPSTPPARFWLAGTGTSDVELAVTVMWFETLEAVKIFAGEDYEAAVVPPKARAILAHFDQRSQHYEVRTSREALPEKEKS